MNHLFDSLAAHPLVSGGILLGALGYLTALLRNLPGQLLNHVKTRLITSAEIPDRDPAFQWLDNWLAKHPEARGRRAYVVRTESGSSLIGSAPPPCAASPGAVPDGRFRFVFSPAPGAGLMRFRGHRLWIERRRRWYETAFNGAPYADTFIVTRLGPVRVIKDLLDEALEESRLTNDPGIPVLVGGSGHWGHQGFRPRRPIESVVLERGVLTDLVTDMERFYGSEDWYQDRGIPWHRGYLFAGVPGAGKTSAAMVLAGRLGLNIAVLSLSSADMDDQVMARMMISLPRRTLLLIEDVDALFQERESRCKLSFAGFLNAIDGIAATDGRLLIMTTNHPEKLDPALIRFGRIDRRVDFKHATPDQARRLFLWFFRHAELTSRELAGLAARFGTTIATGRISMAAIQEHLLRHRDSPAEAARSILPLAIAA